MTVAGVSGQSPQGSTVAFEVASIKPTVDTRFLDPGRPKAGGRWSATATTLSLVLPIAYPEYRFPGLIVGGPGWMREQTFDIDARAPTPNPSAAEYTTMLRRLLTERFKLKVHVEPRPVDVYALVFARSDRRLGPRLKPASAACAEAYASGRLQPQVVPPLFITDRAPDPCTAATHETGNLRRTFGTWSFEATAGMLQLAVERKLVDRTALKGFFEIDFEYDVRTTRATDAPELGVSFFTAVQEQLGLKLEPRRERMDVLVVDSAELPSAN